MRFLRTLKSSVYGPAFYRAIGERRLLSVFGYFALLILLSSVMTSTVPVVDIATFIFRPSEEKDAIRKEVLALYPEELSVRFENGTISTNVAEPYAIPLPRALKAEIGATAKYPSNLLVIDTGKAISASDFETLDTIAILSKDSIGFHDSEKNKTEIQSLGNAQQESFVFDHGKFASYVGIIERFAKGFGIALLFLIPLFVFLAKLIVLPLYLVFGALVIWITAKIRGTGWTYGTSYKAGLHLLTLPLLYEIISSDPLIPALHVPFLFTILLGIAAAINMTPDPAPQEPATTVTAPTAS